MDNMGNKKMDRRVVKTKKAIRNAFAKLLTMKNIDAITIKDIADEADCNRKTIYNYYNGIYEIQDEVENELVEAFETLIKDMDFNSVKDTELIFDRLTGIFNEDIDFYGHLLDPNVNSLLVRKMIHSLKGMLADVFIKQDIFPSDKVGTIVDYISTGMLGAYQGWFMGGKKQSIEDFSKDVSVLVNNGIEILRK